MCATENTVSHRPACFGGRGFVVQQPPRLLISDASPQERDGYARERDARERTEQRYGCERRRRMPLPSADWGDRKPLPTWASGTFRRPGLRFEVPSQPDSATLLWARRPQGRRASFLATRGGQQTHMPPLAAHRSNGATPPPGTCTHCPYLVVTTLAPRSLALG
jgi:hypothetical protein